MIGKVFLACTVGLCAQYVLLSLFFLYHEKLTTNPYSIVCSPEGSGSVMRGAFQGQSELIGGFLLFCSAYLVTTLLLALFTKQKHLVEAVLFFCLGLLVIFISQVVLRHTCFGLIFSRPLSLNSSFVSMVTLEIKYILLSQVPLMAFFFVGTRKFLLFCTTKAKFRHSQ